MANLMAKLLQEAQRTKSLIKAAPGQFMDQFSHYIEDWKETSKQTKQHISDAATSGKSGMDEAKVKKAIEEAAGNVIPGGAIVAGPGKNLVPVLRQSMPGVPIMQYPSNLIKGEDQKYLLKLLAENII